MSALLQVQDLTVELALDRHTRVSVASGASFQIGAGQIVGLFGESGCGKTTLALALLGLLPADRYSVRGFVGLRQRDLLILKERQLEEIRGEEISLVFQEPLLALNPVLRVRDQVAEVIRAHRTWTIQQCRREAEALFHVVGLPEWPRLYNAYPHQLSGGERQRVVIAQALACRPALVIADEPFSALDVTAQVELSSLFRELKEKLGTSFLLISHSPGILTSTADHILVMYAGRIVEQGSPQQVFRDPLHPYTAGLLRSVPPMPQQALQKAKRRFWTIPGNAPDLRGRPKGCPFEPRCEDRMDICVSQMPGEFQPEGRRLVRCFKHEC